VDDVRLLEVLDEAVGAVRHALDDLEDWGPAGTRPGQYRLDLAADDAALRVLHGAGLAVLSEESGTTGANGDGLLAVIDPVDGSTNAHRGVPFFSTSICVLDAEGPRAGLVVNQASGVRFAAVRNEGAERDGAPLRASGCEELGSAIVGISGFPGRSPGWGQFRALGAASLECCAVAEGVLDAYLVAGGSTLYVWDYLAGLLICREAGAAEGERDGKDLVVRDATPRRPMVAATEALVERMREEKTL
jgi:fructose-1,6-bisphosphatase/inositol monophosphatase family enzyme